MTAPRETAASRLSALYADPVEEARRRHQDGAHIVAASWPTIPGELIAAAGLQPCVIRRDPAATPRADARLEPGVFSSRIRTLIDLALGGELTFLSLLLVPRTSEQDHKAFLYLREFARQSAESGRYPRVELFDLLQSDSADSLDYGASRIRSLAGLLAQLTGADIAPARLRRAIAASNRARAAARALLALRRPVPKISGAEAFPLVAAFWSTPADEYAALAAQASVERAGGSGLSGPRLLLAGVPLDHALVHARLEALGAVVVAEDTPWGTRAPGNDVDADLDPFLGLAAQCIDVPGPRTPAMNARRWFEEATANGIDGVVFVIPDDDAVFGWDYPTQRRHLDTVGIPHLLVRGSGRDLADMEGGPDLDAFLSQAARRRRGGHG